MSSLQNGRSKYWCLTINNTHDYNKLNSVKNWDYIVAGREIGDKGYNN